MLTRAPKGKSARQHGIQQHSECPHINALAVILVLFSQLWSHVRRRSAEYLEFLVGHNGRKAKVNDLDHVGLVLNEDVVQLDVPVTHIV